MSKDNSSKGLGRGLDSLIPTGLDTASLINQGERIQNILISDIKPSTDQPRTYFDKEALEELAESIKKHGVIQPIVLSSNEQNKYSIIAGERRWRASQIAGLTRIPALVRNPEEIERLEMALIENVQRVDLSPLEQAVSIERLHQQFNLTYADIAKRLGKAATTVNNIVRLLQLPLTAREALQMGKITEGHARAILALKTMPEKQEQLLSNILESSWSVRQAEQFVLSCKQGVSDKTAVKKRLSATTPETVKLSKKFDSQVSLRRTAKGGRIEIGFKDDDDLNRLINLLAG